MKDQASETLVNIHYFVVVHAILLDLLGNSLSFEDFEDKYFCFYWKGKIVLGYKSEHVKFASHDVSGTVNDYCNLYLQIENGMFVQ